ncbi:MAG: hypothetical protein ACLSHJ_06320 [Oscillospiraceae bacterium]
MRRCCLLLVCLLLLTGCGRADTQDVSSFAPAEGIVWSFSPRTRKRSTSPSSRNLSSAPASGSSWRPAAP